MSAGRTKGSGLSRLAGDFTLPTPGDADLVLSKSESLSGLFGAVTVATLVWLDSVPDPIEGLTAAPSCGPSPNGVGPPRGVAKLSVSGKSA